MATNDFLVFSAGAGSSTNTMTQSNYASSSARVSGVVPGVADPLLANKTWRQSSSVASMIGQFIADYSGNNAVDDGNTATLESSFVLGISSIINARPSITESGSGNSFIVSPSPALASRFEGQVIRFKASHANTGASTLNDGLGTVPLVGISHSALVGGEISLNGNAWVQWNSSVGGSGSYVLLLCTGAASQIPANSYVTGNFKVTGNSAVGTSLSAWTNTFGVIQVGSVAAIASDINSAYFGTNFYGATGGPTRINTGYALQIQGDASAGNLNFNVAGTGSAGSSISWSTILQINNSGASFSTPLTVQPATSAAHACQLSQMQTAVGVSSLANRVINGSMRVDQRNAGASTTITAGAALAYILDMHYVYCTGANITGQQVTISNSQNRFRFTGAASNTGWGFGHRMTSSNTVDLAGAMATLQVKLSSTSITSVTWTAYYANSVNTFGSLASPSKTQIATGTFSINSTEAIYSAQISVPSAATTGIEIVLTGGALAASQTMTIGDLQFQAGSTATTFERRPFEFELMQCCRHFEKSCNYNVPPGSASSLGARSAYQQASTTLFGNTSFLVEKHSAPAVVIYSPGGTGGKVWTSLSDTDTGGGATAMDIGINGFRYISLSTGVGTGPAYTFQFTAESPIG